MTEVGDARISQILSGTGYAMGRVGAVAQVLRMLREAALPNHL
jgi:hypothetical protein